jgi:hypothetical protein
MFGLTLVCTSSGALKKVAMFRCTCSQVLGAWGLGWEVWMDGMEVTQFTYMQQAGSLPLAPVPVEITYGLERIIMALQVREDADVGTQCSEGVS